ncbi:hypothetical protein BDF19DRAFT_439413 [Syncephalis fuscata]|nr:hypothetical protein BDF19DRAFT_439413 [Syncephalis fuscata]
MPREESYGLADLTKDIHTTDPLLFNNNITNKLKTRLSLASTKSRSQRYSGSSTASSVKQTSTDYLPGSQYSTPSESITTLSTPRTSHEQTITIASNNEVYNERSRSTSLFRHFTTRHPHLNDANDTASTKSAPKLKRSGSLSAIKGAIRRASSVRQVLRTPTTSASVSAPAPLVVSDPIVRGGTGGIVDRRHPSRNEWLRSAKSQDRKAAFLKHVQDGEKVLAQKPGLKRAATIMVQRTKEARLQTNTLYMSGGPVSLQRSASLSAVQVAGHSRPDRLQRMKSFRVNAGAAVEQRVPMVARLCAAGFVLSASHPELDDNENEDKKNSSVEFKICDHDNASSCTFMCNGDNDSSAPTILVRVSLNKSQLVQLIVSPKITLTDLKMRINAKFHQCGVINAVVDDQQLIYTDSDGCAVLVNSQKLLEAIISMADGPLTFRVTA